MATGGEVSPLDSGPVSNQQGHAQNGFGLKDGDCIGRGIEGRLKKFLDGEIPILPEVLIEVGLQ